MTPKIYAKTKLWLKQWTLNFGDDFITIRAGFFSDDLVDRTVGDLVGKHDPGVYLVESHQRFKGELLFR